MKVLGIDPAPSKNSVVFDGDTFKEFSPRELKDYIEDITKSNSSLFISWDAPLSAAIDEENFSLTIRKIERFFNRLGRYAKGLEIPEGISTLGYASCPHWSISQYIFGLPIISPSFQHSSRFKLIMNEDDIESRGLYITEIHPALSMWILLKDRFKKNKHFENSWKYKGDNKEETIKKRTYLIAELLKLDIVKKELPKNRLIIDSDDKLDAFVCWLMATLLVKKDKSAKIYGNNLDGSFLLPYDEEIHDKLNVYLTLE